eukprot:gene36035-65008_t
MAPPPADGGDAMAAAAKMAGRGAHPRAARGRATCPCRRRPPFAAAELRAMDTPHPTGCTGAAAPAPTASLDALKNAAPVQRPMANNSVLRLSPANGRAYDKRQFLAFYSDSGAHRR